MKVKPILQRFQKLKIFPNFYNDLLRFREKEAEREWLDNSLR